MKDFYPRSPCGERLWPGLLARPFFIISIHALLAESDRGGDSCYLDNIISIHALLAESDIIKRLERWAILNFYPRSPCGERRLIISVVSSPGKFLSTLSLRRATRYNHFYPQPKGISIHALLAESDRRPHKSIINSIIFLSTLSLRRATSHVLQRDKQPDISIHALLAESDATLT